MRKILISILTFTAFVLAACGGGGGSGAAASGVSMTVSGKSLDFTWTADSFTGITIANIDHYRISVNPDGVSGFTVEPSASNITTTSHSIEIPVHKTNWLAAQYIVEACNLGETNCVASPNQTLALIDSVAATIYVKASNTEAGDQFGGYAVSISDDGNTLAVGAYQEDSIATGVGGNQANNTAPASGAVYVFNRTGTTWAQQAYVKASNTAAVDYFGWSVALSSNGNTLAVGAYREDSIATGIGGNQASNAAADAGAVYVFNRTGTAWAQQAYVKASNSNAGDYFGYSISLSDNGNTLAVGAYREASIATGIGGNQASNAALDAGAVYVFSRTGTTWAQQAYVKASNAEASDSFGISVTLSGDGNTLAVGADREASNATGIGGNQANNALSSGAVYVFSRTGVIWAQQAYVKASNTGLFDHFGVSVALNIDGNTLAVGADREDSAATGIGGNQADNTVGNSGAVYVFSRTGTAWTQQAYVKASNTGGDNFGISVVLSGDGNTLAVGAQESSNAVGIDGNQADNSAGSSGAVYVFSRTGTTWMQKSYVKASNTRTSGLFASTVGSIALNSNGNSLAVGAYGDKGVTTGVGGNQADTSVNNSGAVYLY